jgi:hypothetical protein
MGVSAIQARGAPVAAAGRRLVASVERCELELAPFPSGLGRRVVRLVFEL